MLALRLKQTKKLLLANLYNKYLHLSQIFSKIYICWINSFILTNITQKNDKKFRKKNLYALEQINLLKIFQFLYMVHLNKSIKFLIGYWTHIIFSLSIVNKPV